VVKLKDQIRKFIYVASGLLVLMGIFFMRWNVVIGGQLFSKSFLGFTSFKISPIGAEGFMMAVFWMILPFGILAFLLWLMPPWKKKEMSE
jgi:predicted membrane protein